MKFVAEIRKLNSQLLSLLVVDEIDEVINYRARRAQSQNNILASSFELQVLALSGSTPTKEIDRLMEWTLVPAGQARGNALDDLGVIIRPPHMVYASLSVTELGPDEEANVDILFDMLPASSRAMIFVQGKAEAPKLAEKLSSKFSACGQLRQVYYAHRDDFEQWEPWSVSRDGILCCTTIAARGVNVVPLNHVFVWRGTYSIPTFVQMIGRAGRDKTASKAVFLLAPPRPEDALQLRDDVLQLQNWALTKDSCRVANLMRHFDKKKVCSCLEHCDDCSSRGIASQPCDVCSGILATREKEAEQRFFGFPEVIDEEEMPAVLHALFPPNLFSCLRCLLHFGHVDQSHHHAEVACPSYSPEIPEFSDLVRGFGRCYGCGYRLGIHCSCKADVSPSQKFIPVWVTLCSSGRLYGQDEFFQSLLDRLSGRAHEFALAGGTSPDFLLQNDFRLEVPNFFFLAGHYLRLLHQGTPDTWLPYEVEPSQFYEVSDVDHELPPAPRPEPRAYGGQPECHWQPAVPANASPRAPASRRTLPARETEIYPLKVAIP